MRFIAFIVVTVMCGKAFAHPLDLGYLRITQDDETVDVTLDLDVGAAAILLGEPQPQAVDSRASELAAASFAREPIRTDRGDCTWGPAIAELRDNTVTLRSTASCPPGECRWDLAFVRDHRVSPGFTLMVKQSSGATEQLTLVDAENHAIVLAAPSKPAEVSFAHFVALGVEHIGAAPNQWHSSDTGWHLPEGLDHILFLIALMLGGGSLLHFGKVATGFTAGHSVTLAIAALGIARPPSSVIEPLIALSIALVAAESLIGKYERHRWKIAAAFGLIHGFGFASVLTGLNLSTRGLVTALFGFNVGVELGQLVVVLAFAPVVLFVHRMSKAGRYALKAAAVVIFALGAYWFIERCS